LSERSPRVSAVSWHDTALSVGAVAASLTYYILYVFAGSISSLLTSFPSFLTSFPILTTESCHIFWDWV
jgi:hypothetical protein